MSAATEQLLPELTRRVAELANCLAELAERAGIDSAVTGPVGSDTVCIELLTENGFWITRPWEVDGSPAPCEGACCFLVRHPKGDERATNVEIAEAVIIETAFQTRGRIQLASSFWICCAERHLADYVAEHNGFPKGDHLVVQTLDPEEVLLALRWEESA